MNFSSNPAPKAAVRWPFAVLLVLAVGGLLVLFWRVKPVPKPVVLPEARRSELSLREKRLYRAGEAQPFTGIMVEHYPGGAVQSRSVVSNGVLHGFSRGWYTNGQMQVEEIFLNGVSDGTRVKWHANGRKESEASIAQGKLHGTFTRWHENGTLAERIEMKNGQPDGESIAWYPSGFVKARARLEKGEVREQKFWKDGEWRIPKSGPLPP